MKVRRVLHEGPRSAEPPSSHGTFRAIAFNATPDASRVATPLSSARKDGQAHLSQRFRQLAPQHTIAMIGELWILALVRFEFTPPCLVQCLAARADPALEVLAHALGHEELSILRPAIIVLGKLDFFFPQRLAYLVWPGPISDLDWRKRLMSSSSTDKWPSVSYFGLTALTPVRWSIA